MTEKWALFQRSALNLMGMLIYFFSHRVGACLRGHLVKGAQLIEALWLWILYIDNAHDYSFS